MILETSKIQNSDSHKSDWQEDNSLFNFMDVELYGCVRMDMYLKIVFKAANAQKWI